MQMSISVSDPAIIHENDELNKLMNKTPELLTKPTLSKEQVEANFHEFHLHNQLPSALRFRIAVPKDWRITDTNPQEPDPETPLVAIARLGPESGEAEIMVWCAFLPREMHPVDWLTAWVRSQNYRVLAQRDAHTAYGVTGDLIAERVHRNQTQWCRLTTFKDAERIFLLQSCAAETNFAGLQETFLLAVIRFGLLEPTKQKLAESFTWKTLAGAYPIRLLAPVSWVATDIAEPPVGGSGIQLENKLNGSTVGTLLVIRGAQNTDLASIEQVTLEKLANNGFQLAAGKAQTISTTERNGTRVTIAELDAVRAGARYHLKIARLLFADGMLLVLLVSPDQTVSFEAWAINRRAFEIAFNTVEQQPQVH